MEPPTSSPQGVPPTNLQHSYTKGTPCPNPLLLTQREYHPPTYNTHTLKGPAFPTSLPPTQREYHTPTYNTHTLKGPPSPTSLPPTHRECHTPTYNTHTLKGPPTPYPQGVPPTNLQLSHINIPPYPTPMLLTHRNYDP